MIIRPMIRNNICLNSHPAGCAAVVKRQIDYVKSRFAGNANTPETPRLALVVGCSTGYGLASRIAASFGYGAATAGVSLEKPPSAAKTGTPGFYNNRAFDRAASFEHIPSKTLNADAFSDSAKAQAAAAVKELAEARGIPPEIDLFIYSLASPARTDPETGAVYRSVIKPIGARYTGKTLDMMSGKLFSASAEAATEEETAHTVKVMGGEDWERWIDALSAEGVLSPKVRALAYTYIGPELSWPIYKNGTIGRAKEDLERAARAIHARLAPAGGGAWVSVNKALVTRASAVIPVIPFYVSCLFKTMKEHGLHEGCAEQITRLFREKLYAPGKGGPEVDGEGRIRMDDWEMRQDIQKETGWRMAAMTEEQVFTLSDAAGFKHDFLEAHGFDAAGVDYNADTDPLGI